MLNTKTTSALMVVMLAMGAFAGAVHAEDAKIKKISLSVTVPFKSEINVTSSDGTRWDTIVPETVPLWIDTLVDTKHPGYVERAGLFMGECLETGCAVNPLVAFAVPKRRDWDFHGEVKVPTSAIASSAEGDKILNACNGGAQQADTSQAHSIDEHLVAATLSVNTRKKGTAVNAVGSNPDLLAVLDGFDFNGGDASTIRRFKIKVNCLSFSMAQAPPQPYSINVEVEQKGKICPKETDVRAIMKFRAPTTARFRFKVDGKLSKVHEIKARKVSGGKPPPPGVGGPGAGTYYLVERVKTYHLDPGQHHFRVVMEGGKGKKSAVITRRVKCPSFKIISNTLDYKVEKKLTCPKKVEETLKAIATRPGKAKFEIKTQAGLVVHSGTAVFKRKGMKYVATSKRPNLSMSAFKSDMMADFKKYSANSGWVLLEVGCMEVLSGTLEQSGFAADRCEGEAAFSIRTNGPGKVPYRLECTGGRAWTGKVQAHETGPNTFIGVDTVRFDVSNNELVRCALRTRKPLPFKVLAGDKRTYECHKPTDVSGSDDLAPETRPEDPPPRGRKLTGDFSFIDNGGTKCPRGRAFISFRSGVADNIHYSLDCTNGSHSGVAQTAPHPKGGYAAAATIDLDVEKTTQVNCALKTVAPEKKTLKVKGHLFRCVKVVGPVGPVDLTPETRPDSQDPRAPVVVIDPPRTSDDPGGPGKTIDPGPEISCAGGVVQKDECLCPRTHKVVAAGKNAFRCVRSAVIDPVRPDKGGKTTDATPDYGKKTRHDTEADPKRLEALKKRQEAKKRAEAARRKKTKEEAAKRRREREAAKKAAERRRKAAKKAAELKRKRAAAKKKAAELRRKRKTAAARRKRKRKAASAPEP